MKLQDYGINTKGKISGQFKTTCPKCSQDRKKKSDPCLSVNIDEQVWNCHNCGWTGSVNKRKEVVEYVKPAWSNYTELSEKLVRWFADRGITQKTLIRNKITEGKTYMPQISKEINTIQFNYFNGDELINIKYRDGSKNFKMVKDAEKIFYGLNDIIDSEEIIIVEGEMDKLSFEEAGYKNCISVPNGASNRKMNYLDSCEDILNNVKKVYLATDNDEAGVKLQKELSRRIGRDKCYIISYPEECKDANDVIIKYNTIELDKCIQNAQPYPLEGVVSISSISDDIDRLYADGLNKGLTVGHGAVDNTFSFVTSQLTVITGIPTHGKSHFLEHLCMRLSCKHGWKFGVFSPEHFPIELHFSVLAEKFIGKSFRITPDYNKMDAQELEYAKEFINEHYHWIRPDSETFTVDSILDATKSLVMRHGINAAIIDPWNKISHDFGSGNETTYVNNLLTRLNIFKQKYDIHIFLVAHPRKMMKNHQGMYDVPTLYDIAGSSHFYNQVDNGITVYRDFRELKTTIHVQKVKFRHLGMIDAVDFEYNYQNGRFHELGDYPDNDLYYVKTEDYEFER